LGGDILFFDNTLDEDDIGEMAGASASDGHAVPCFQEYGLTFVDAVEGAADGPGRSKSASQVYCVLPFFVLFDLFDDASDGEDLVEVLAAGQRFAAVEGVYQLPCGDPDIRFPETVGGFGGKMIFIVHIYVDGHPGQEHKKEGSPVFYPFLHSLTLFT
jgi:hypothetical protein